MQSFNIYHDGSSALGYFPLVLNFGQELMLTHIISRCFLDKEHGVSR
jgi:hypothetical protein